MNREKMLKQLLICASTATLALSPLSFVFAKEICQDVFSDQQIYRNTLRTSLAKPPVQSFIKSPGFQKILSTLSAQLPSEHPRILVAQFKNSHAQLAGAFTLFILLSPSIALGQQSLFNAPSVEPTEKDKFFFQEQVNILPKDGISNSTLDFGLGDGWSIGMSIFNLKAYSAQTNFIDPDFLVNIEKTVQITPYWRIGMGGQTGSNIANNPAHVAQLKSFSYFQNMFALPNDLGKLYVGYYHANDGFTGDKTSDGAILGIEVPLVKDKLSFMADYLSGNSPISVGVIGMVYTLDNKTQISLGAQVPAPKSGNDYGAVFELTIPTF